MTKHKVYRMVSKFNRWSQFSTDNSYYHRENVPINNKVYYRYFIHLLLKYYSCSLLLFQTWI